MRRALALAAAAALTGCGGSPPADQAADLVPGDALLYVHLSTDPDREQDREVLRRLRKLPAFAPVDAALTKARPWLGDEAAFAVTPRGTVAILAVRDQDAARAALPDARFFGRFARVGDGRQRRGAVRRGRLREGRARAATASPTSTPPPAPPGCSRRRCASSAGARPSPT